jgi:hypothetical protein
MACDRLLFIDETGASTKMVRLYGRLPEVRAVLHRCRTVTRKRRRSSARFGAIGLTAPMVLDRPRDGPAFEAYVQEVVAPTLRSGDRQSARSRARC